MGSYEAETFDDPIYQNVVFECMSIILEKAPKGAGFLVLLFDEDTSDTIKFACSNPEHVAPAYLRLLTMMPDEDDYDSTR